MSDSQKSSNVSKPCTIKIKFHKASDYPLKFPPELWSLYGECPKNMRGFDYGIKLDQNQGYLK